ncbi:MAG: hypothetical protein U1E28_02910 [Beijerinckiaceae bacterium]
MLLTSANHFYANVAILDLTGRIVDVNMSWKMFARENGLADPNSCIGADYVAACVGEDVNPEFLVELKDLLAGRRASIARWYPCHMPSGAKRWFVVLGSRHDDHIALAHVDVTSMATHSFIARMELETSSASPRVFPTRG